MKNLIGFNCYINTLKLSDLNFNVIYFFVVSLETSLFIYKEKQLAGFRWSVKIQKVKQNVEKKEKDKNEIFYFILLHKIP